MAIVAFAGRKVGFYSRSGAVRACMPGDVRRERAGRASVVPSLQPPVRHQWRLTGAAARQPWPALALIPMETEDDEAASR